MLTSLDEACNELHSPRISRAGERLDDDVIDNEFLRTLNRLGTLHDREVTALRRENAQLHRQMGQMQSTLDHIHTSAVCASIDEPRMRTLKHEVAADFDILSTEAGDAGEAEVKPAKRLRGEDEDEDLDTLLQAKKVVDLDDLLTDFESAPDTDSEGSQPPTRSGSLGNWLRLVDGVLQAANTKRLYELRGHWIKPERFMQRVLKKNTQLDLAPLSADKMARSRRRGSERLFASIKRLKTGPLKTGTGPVAPGRSSFVLEPHSPKRVAWMGLGMVLMVYDLIMLPMQTFNIDESEPFFFGVQWFGQIFWTSDILVTFFTAVYINSELCTSLSRIARTYASTWLVLDLVVVGPLWVVELAGLDSKAAKSTAIIKYVRMLRFLRLMRLAKFEHYLQEALAAVNSSALLLSVGIVKLMTMLIIANHLNACLWYYVGSRGDGGWVDHFEGTSLPYRYLTSMHWAITQFQGTSDILPGMGGGKDLRERAYAVVTVVFALIILSAFVSALTNMMMQLQSLRETNTRKQRSIRAYLGENHISLQLSVRVKKYVDWKQSTAKSLHFGGEDERFKEVFDSLPRGLQMDIMQEVRGPLVVRHPFFGALIERHPRTFSMICYEAFKANFPAPDETIFLPQDQCTQMYFVAAGKCRYIATALAINPMRFSSRVPGKATDYGSKDAVELGVGQWLCEGVLWTSWEHMGVLVGSQDPVLLLLNEQDFRRVVVAHPPAHVSAVLYARQFIAGLNRFGVVYSDIIDLSVLVDRTSEIAVL